MWKLFSLFSSTYNLGFVGPFCCFGDILACSFWSKKKESVFVETPGIAVCLMPRKQVFFSSKHLTYLLLFLYVSKLSLNNFF